MSQYEISVPVELHLFRVSIQAIRKIPWVTPTDYLYYSESPFRGKGVVHVGELYTLWLKHRYSRTSRTKLQPWIYTAITRHNGRMF